MQNMVCCVSYLFSCCPKNPFKRLYVDHPQCYLSVFNQRKRFRELHFGWSREFLASFGVVADLESRVGCWKNFRFTILQKVLLQLHYSFKARYFPDAAGVVPVFVGCFQHAQTDVHGVSNHIFLDFTEMLKLLKIHFGIGVCSSVLFFRQRFSK